MIDGSLPAANSRELRAEPAPQIRSAQSWWGTSGWRNGNACTTTGLQRPPGRGHTDQDSSSVGRVERRKTGLQVRVCPANLCSRKEPAWRKQNSSPPSNADAVRESRDSTAKPAK